MTERLRQRVVSSMDPISDTEIDILLATEDFSGGEYDISHIMIMVPNGASPQQVQEAQGTHREHPPAAAGRQGLLPPRPSAFSESQDALEGGRIGWRDLNSMPREFADAIGGMQPGQFSQPLRSPGGFHVVMVNDYRDRQQVMAEEFRANHIMIAPNELVSPRDAMEQMRGPPRTTGQRRRFRRPGPRTFRRHHQRQSRW